jgi:C-terminal processing protease CtpA/Prc
MKYRDPLIVLLTALLIGSGSMAKAAGRDETTAQAAERAAMAAQQSRLEAEHQKALAEAERQQLEAEATLERAHEHLREVSEQRKKLAGESAEASQAREAQAAEMARMQQELSQARRDLRETSREIARVSREVTRERIRSEPSSYVHRTSGRPVLGVILGDANDIGIEVIGVSPDGPSERAGIRKDDVIIAVGGCVLATGDESGDVRKGISIALEDIKADEPVIVSVERGDQTLDLTVVPEIREPLGWQTVTRFPTAPAKPSAPGEAIRIERIVVPEIDTEQLAEQIEQIRINIDERELLKAANEALEHAWEYEFEFHDLSEMGDIALHDANVWFGLPMTQGLKLAEIDPGLGEYFKTDRGVLVLKARADNDLQLESGDVILQVGNTEVNSPAEFVRSLREFEAGQELSIEIKRNRKDKTLSAVMPERRIGFLAPGFSTARSVHFSHDTD